jgi:E3 ubiquitin-protein ligase UBR3
MGRAMENMTTATQRIVKKHPPTVQSLFSFVVSIARTNLESEIIQRGGTLCNATNETDATAMLRIKPKRDCIGKFEFILCKC